MRFFIILLAALAVVGCKPSGGKGQKVLGPLETNRVVAIVNGEEVLAGPVEEILRRRLKMYEQRTDQRLPFEQVEQERRRLIEQLITETVVRQAVDKSNIAVSDKEIDARIVEIKQEFGDDEAFDQYLGQSGYTLDAFREDLRADLKAAALMEADMGAATATVARAMEYYETHPDEFAYPESIDVSHVLLSIAADAPAETQQATIAKLKGIRQEIIKGLDFAKAAEKHSECPTAKMGGRIGPVARNDRRIAMPFARAAFAIPVSNVSDVVETEYGVHLIYVTGKNVAVTATFDDVQTDLLGFLNESKKREKGDEWTQDLRAKADVKYK